MAKRAGTSLEKGLALLQALASASTSMTVASLADAAGVNRTTAYRLCDSLEQAGWIHTVSEDDGSRRVDIGPHVFGLAVMVANKYDAEARLQPILDDLAREAGETVHSAILDGIEVVHVARGVPDSGRHMALEIGAREQAHVTSLGKAMLATMDRNEVLALYPDEDLPGATPKAITTRTALLEDLDRVLIDGYAIDDEESSHGIKCIGAPVFGAARKPLMAISVTTIPQRLDAGRLEEIADALLESSAAATSVFAGEPPEGYRS